MDQSDAAEDDRFVKHIVTELSAFQKTDKSEQGMNDQTSAQDPNEAPKTVSNVSETRSRQDVAAEGGIDSEPSKPAGRIIRLSRPNNPYATARGSIPSTTSTTMSSGSPAPSTVNGDHGTSTVTPSGAPGSRLAALQRPGSPMHRILQRAQSPALARLTRQASSQEKQDDPSSGAGSDHEAAESQLIGSSQLTGSSQHTVSRDTPDASSDTPSQSVPPRISAMSSQGALLLRRPRSPLHSGKSQMTNQEPLPAGETPSPRSPPSMQPLSPKDSSPPDNTEDSSVSERAALRNKLRANSFRLKDLLSKRPVIRSQDDISNDKEECNTTETRSENTAATNRLDNTEEKVADTGAARNITDRTRWRREGLSRSKSTASEKTALLISARYLRTRTRNNTQAADDSHVSSDNKPPDACVTDKLNNDSANSVNRTTTSNIIARSRAGNSDGSDPIGAVGRGTVGATLLRSPKTRTPGGAGALSSPQEPSGTTDLGDKDQNERLKGISDLEKDHDVNLVFDSVTIGQPLTRDSAGEGTADTSQLYKEDVNQSAGSRISSEPATPHRSDVESTPLRESKSCDNTADADFTRSSTAMKRSFVVTDLDKAMRDRDEQKLSSLRKVRQGDDDTQSSATNSPLKLQASEDKTEVLPQQISQLETDLDARLVTTHRMVTCSPRIRQRLSSSQDEPQSPPYSAPPVHPVAPLNYKPHISLEDAVKWPMDVPGKLDFRKMEVFEGSMLLNWLSGSIDKSHYLRLVMTKHDISVIVCQVCTCLLAAGVIKQLEGKDLEGVFKTDCMYYWTHSQQNSTSVTQDVNKLQPMWPPAQEPEEDKRPGLKYTEADHQAAMVTLRHEYKEEVDNIQQEHQGVLDRARKEYETRLQQAIERIAVLQKEVDKYKCLAGIERLSQKALSDADAAQLEAGLRPDMVNGFSTPMSQYQTPAGTPDALNNTYPVNFVKSSNDLFPEYGSGDHMLDGASCSGSDTTSLAGSVGEGGESLAPPPAPPPPPGVVPPPAPPILSSQKKPLKPEIKPLSPMRPLFWNRIQVNDIKTPKHKEYYERRLVWEELQEEKIDITELDELFSKRQVEPSRKFSPFKQKQKTIQPAKVMSPKRSQVIGILLSSLRVEMSDIEHAILTFDTSQIPEEKLRQIYENRGDAEEIKKLKDYLKKHPDTPLDKPDQFIYDLSLIPDYAERIFCFIFREAFQESISVIETKMTNLRMTCQSLMTSIHVKRVLGVVLALGNYMNGGSKSRGQADGFGIEILPKLKDVKSKDNSTSLLHYMVQQYIRKFERDDAGTEKVKFPLPDPSDLTQGCQVCFDELEKELQRIKKDFTAAEERADKVITSARELVYLQPFKDIMTDFFEKGRQEFIEQEENLADGKRLFQETVIFFCVKPKSGDKEVTPEYFFSLWCTFSQDFKDTWKREQQKIIKIRIKENEQKVKQMQQRLAKQPVRTRTRKAGGLKDKLARQGLLES